MFHSEQVYDAGREWLAVQNARNRQYNSTIVHCMDSNIVHCMNTNHTIIMKESAVVPNHYIMV